MSSLPDQPVPARPENMQCVLPDGRRLPGDHALDGIVIIVVITIICGHWAAGEVLDLITVILAALGVRTFKQA